MRNRKELKKNINPSVINRGSTAGITIIALVVTIVILLILAGITIASFTGDKGIVNETKEMTNGIGDLQNKTIDDLQQIANELSSITGNTLNSDNQNPDNPNQEGPVEEVPIENIKSDWETINKIAKAIAKNNTITSDSEEAVVTVEGKKYTIKPGDMFEVEYEGEIRRVRVLGFKHDDLVNTGVYGGNHSKASISFGFEEFMLGDTYKWMDSADTYSKNWAEAKMRKNLNGYTTNSATQSGAIGGLGANLNNKAYIKQVKKKYIAIYNDASSVTTCDDYLWYLAASEIVNDGVQNGAYAYAITSEGNQYKYYAQENPSWITSNGVLEKRPSLSKSSYWWQLRSMVYNSYTYCTVDFEGRIALSGYNRPGEYGVAPGFCI